MTTIPPSPQRSSTARPSTAQPIAEQAIAPLQIGPLRVDPPVVLAPMAGVTNVAFRRLCREFGAGLYVSEMVTARALVERSVRTMRMVVRDDGEPTHSVQLYGVDPAVVGKATQILVDEIGVDHVDLNFGCPVAKVTRKGGGAALPAHPVLFGRIVEAAVQAARHIPVTVKMRLGVDDEIRTDHRAARIAEDAGASAVALHARTAQQLYSGSARWEAIGELAELVDTIPVLGNGDIWDADDALRMLHSTGCDGVVVGRGCLGRPWLFGELVDAFAGRTPPPPPTFATTMHTMRRHLDLLCDHLGEDRGVRDFRKHVGWYLTGWPVGRQRRRSLVEARDLDQMRTELDITEATLDGQSRLSPAQARLPRGHSNGPRPVSLPEGWLSDIDDPTPPTGADVLVSGG